MFELHNAASASVRTKSSNRSATVKCVARRSAFLLCTAAILSGIEPSHSQAEPVPQSVWKGGVNSDWSNPLNWTGGIPDSTIWAFLGDPSRGNLTAIATGTQAFADKVTINQGNELVVEGGSLRVSDIISISTSSLAGDPRGSMIIKAGGHVVTDRLFVADGRNQGSLTVSGGDAVLTVNLSQPNNVDNRFVVGGWGDGVLLLNNGGTINVGGTNPLELGNIFGDREATGVLSIGQGELSGTINAAEIHFNTKTSWIGADFTDAMTIGSKITGTGYLIKNGTGTLTLTGMNTYSGTTTIRGGTLALSGQGRINASSAVVVNGILDVSAAASAQINNLSGTGTVVLGGRSLLISNAASTFSGNISGTGGINISSGTQVLSGQNSFTGGAGISAGARLEIGDGGSTGSIVSNVTNYGTLSFNRADEITYAGIVTGPGSFEQLGTGKLILTGTSSSSGNVQIANGSTLQLGNGGTTGLIGGTNFPGTITNDGTLIYDRSNTLTWRGAYNGTGEIIQAGTGTLLLTGDSSAFAGNTTVKNGTMLVGNSLGAGKLGGNIAVLSGATLGGSGSIGSGAGSAVNISSGGTLAAGNSIGTMNINGNLNLATGGNLGVEIAGDGSTDLVNVTGTATIAGSNLYVTAIDPETSYQNGQTYRVLNADVGVSGEFSNAVSRSAFLNFGLSYNPNSVDLTIALNNGGTDPGTPEPRSLFKRVAGTSNQYATASALDTLVQSGASLELYNDLLMLSADEARGSFDSLSGEVYASTASVLIDQSQFVRGAMNSRLQQAFGARVAAPIEQLPFFPVPKPASSQAIEQAAPRTPAVPQTPYSAWGYAFGAWGVLDGNKNTGDLKSSVGGFASGVDAAVLDTWRIGVLAEYSRSSFRVNDRSSSGNSDNYTLGAYAGSQWSISDNAALNLRSGLAYTWHNISMNRSIAFPGVTDSLSSDYDASTLQIFGELGYQMKVNRSLLEPYANLAFVRFRSDGFGEDGLTAAALSVNSETTNTSFSTLGFRASTDFDIGNVPFTARGDIGWRHAFGDVTPISAASFVGSDDFSVSGSPIAKDFALLEAGFDIPLNDAAKIGISYNGQFGTGAVQNGVNARFSVGF
ncbi:hypothetical protein Brsp04_02136 [Brucella sp. NBRC 12952]|uniref:Autotransporter domain-containing protein n=1 Tax=Brucella pseudogrignonensis TaxID=419475 RepID=A0A7Y3T693_9HYPH|nr:autotransporter domain-containing protein [Brucella pseudogrignonensis]NNV20012.1 autotransporter domain-containing protein [Brucella pseudogrignonensis]